MFRQGKGGWNDQKKTKGGRSVLKNWVRKRERPKGKETPFLNDSKQKRMSHYHRGNRRITPAKRENLTWCV